MRKSKVNDTWVNTCKICKLFVTHQDLWIEIHRMVLTEKDPYTKVMKWFATKADFHNATLEDPTNVDDPKFLVALKSWNFQAHFTGSPVAPGEQPKTGHATDFYAVRRLVEDKKDHKDLEMIKEAQEVLSAVKRPQPGKKGLDNRELQEYISLASMVANLEAALHIFDLDFKDKVREGRKINIKDIEDYQKQVQGLIDINIKMSNLRNTKAITGAAVEVAIEMLATQFLEKLIGSVNDAKALLESEMRGSSLPQEIATMILHTEKDAMKAIIPEVLKQVLSQFRIKK